MTAVEGLRRDWREHERVKVARNKGLFERFMRAYDKRPGVRVGDYVKDASGAVRRVAYIWRDERGKPFQWQTESGAGSYSLGDGVVGMSGSLDSGFQEGSEFKQVGTKRGSVWVFDEDVAGAGRGVYSTARFRLFKLVKGRFEE